MENTCTPNIKSSYTYEDLLASGRGELFGKEGPQLPAPTMLMIRYSSRFTVFRLPLYW